MRNARKVMKKDLDKVFKFPSAIFSTLILPGLILFLIYALMGSTTSSLISGDEDYFSKIHIINAPQSFEVYTTDEIGDELKIDYSFGEGTDNTVDLEKLENGDYDLVIIFENNFDEGLSNNTKPLLSVYNEHTSMSSLGAMDKISGLINQYKESLLQEKGIDPIIISDAYASVTDINKSNAFGLATILPMIIVIFVFAGSMSIGADAIAGEKERGTLASLLMAPIKRNDLILGKVFSTSIISLLSSISSFLGVLAALPFMKSMFGLQGGVTYGVGSYLQLLVVIVLLAAFASSLVLVCSTIAKSVKEATNYALPVYFVAMLVAILTMFATWKTDLYLFAIPIYNIAIGLKGILSFELMTSQLIVVVVSNIIYICGLVFLLVRLFKSEKILYSK